MTATTDLSVIENQTNTAISNGGVAEFEIGSPLNPVVALQGSGTADAPHIVFYFNTTGAANITVSYNLRDIDANDNAIQPVALQYRVGSSGSFANVDAAYVADATNGPGLVQPVTPVSAVLPADANNQSLVQVRVITGNAAGSDEFVGVDDISVVAGQDPEPTPTPTPDPTPTATPSPTPSPSPTPPPAEITISQVYGGGGNANAPFQNDFIELFNPTASEVSLVGWSVQYASSTGTSWQVTPLGKTIPAGGHYLVQEAAGTTIITTPPPDPDATGVIPMAAGSGKVALREHHRAAVRIVPDPHGHH